MIRLRRVGKRGQASRGVVGTPATSPTAQHGGSGAQGELPPLPLGRPRDLPGRADSGGDGLPSSCTDNPGSVAGRVVGGERKPFPAPATLSPQPSRDFLDDVDRAVAEVQYERWLSR